MRKFLTTTKHITDCYECNLFERTEENTICQVNKQPIYGFPEPTNCPLPDVEKMDLSWKSNGIHPTFSKSYTRRARIDDATIKEFTTILTENLS